MWVSVSMTVYVNICHGSIACAGEFYIILVNSYVFTSVKSTCAHNTKQFKSMGVCVHDIINVVVGLREFMEVDRFTHDSCPIHVSMMLASTRTTLLSRLVEICVDHAMCVRNFTRDDALASVKSNPEALLFIMLEYKRIVTLFVKDSVSHRDGIPEWLLCMIADRYILEREPSLIFPINYDEYLTIDE